MWSAQVSSPVRQRKWFDPDRNAAHLSDPNSDPNRPFCPTHRGNFSSSHRYNTCSSSAENVSRMLHSRLLNIVVRKTTVTSSSSTFHHQTSRYTQRRNLLLWTFKIKVSPVSPSDMQRENKLKVKHNDAHNTIPDLYCITNIDTSA